MDEPGEKAGPKVERLSPAIPLPLHWHCMVVGALVWVLPGLRGREAWDLSSYFVLSIPLMSAVAAVAAYRAPARSWRWPLWLIAGQAAAAIVFHGGGNLLPLGLIVFFVLGLPLFVAAAIAGRIALRKAR